MFCEAVALDLLRVAAFAFALARRAACFSFGAMASRVDNDTTTREGYAGRGLSQSCDAVAVACRQNAILLQFAWRAHGHQCKHTQTPASQCAHFFFRHLRPSHILSHSTARRPSVCELRSLLRIHTTFQSYQGTARIIVDPALRSGVTLALYVLGERLVLIHEVSATALLKHASTQLAARLPRARARGRH